MSERRPKKRSKKSTALVEGDPDTAEAFTHETITTVTSRGVTVTQDVLVPFVPLIEEGENSPPVQAEDFVPPAESYSYEQPDLPNDPPRSRHVRYLSCIDD